MLLEPLDRGAPFGGGRLTNCVLLTEKAYLVNGLFKGDPLEPLYRHEVFTSLWIVSEFSVVVAPFQYLQRRHFALRSVDLKRRCGLRWPRNARNASKTVTRCFNPHPVTSGQQFQGVAKPSSAAGGDEPVLDCLVSGTRFAVT